MGGKENRGGEWIQEQHSSTSAELPRTSRSTTLSRSLTPLQCVTASRFSSPADEDAGADMLRAVELDGERSGGRGRDSKQALIGEFSPLCCCRGT